MQFNIFNISIEFPMKSVDSIVVRGDVNVKLDKFRHANVNAPQTINYA